jgi:chromosome segregation ATPase
MFVHRAPSASDLQSLVEILKNPGEAKAFISTLDSKLKALAERESAVLAQERESAATFKSAGKREVEIAQELSELEAEKKKLGLAREGLVAHRKDLESRERDLKEKWDRFEKESNDRAEQLIFLEKSLAKREAGLSEVSAKASALIAEYEDKLAKLKAVMGA